MCDNYGITTYKVVEIIKEKMMKDSTKAILAGMALGAVTCAVMSEKKGKGSIVGAVTGGAIGAGASYLANQKSKKLAYKK